MNKVSLFGALLSLLLCIPSVYAIDVTLTGDLGEAVPVGAPVTFTATATGTNSATMYTFDFDDGTKPVTQTSPTIVHVFTKEDQALSVTVDVKNGVDPDGVDLLLIEAVAAPPATDPPGVNAGDPPETNPDNGDTFTLTDCKDGVLSGTLSAGGATSASRVVGEFKTDFGDTIAGRTGTNILHHYASPGIYVMTSVHSTNGSEDGKLRKTLAFSEMEIDGVNSDPNVVDPAPTTRKLQFKSVKGKFNFGGGKTAARASTKVGDKVQISWTMTLPAGFDIEGDTQNIQIAIGNVVESFQLKSNGTATASTQPSPYQSVKFKLPKLKKGQTVVTAPFTSTVSVTMNQVGLSSRGFDTEGITPKEAQNKNSKGPFGRTIQVATTFAGVSYTGLANVNLEVSKGNSFGTISSRSK